MTNEITNIYEMFDAFLQKTIIEKRSFFDEAQSIDNSTIDALISAYILNSLSNNQLNKYSKQDPAYKKLIDNERSTFTKKSKMQIEILSLKSGEELKRLKHLFASLLWLRYLPIADTKKETKKNIVENWIGSINSQTNYFPDDGLASYGMAQQQIDTEMVHLICLFSYLFSLKHPIGQQDESSESNKGVDFIKVKIIDWVFNRNDCKINFIGEDSRKSTWKNRIEAEKHLPIYNMLLHLCDKSEYEDTAIQHHKENIVKYLYPEFVGKEEWEKVKDNYTQLTEIDGYIKEIVKNIKEKISDKYNGLWAPNILAKWKGGYVASAYEILMNYQKQIILYGAPGTGKTYNAKKLIQQFIDVNDDYEQDADLEEHKLITLDQFKFKLKTEQSVAQVLEKNVLDEVLKDKKVIWEMVQFNQSFSYEDFIEGMRPQENNELKIVDGIFKRFANTAGLNPEKTFILIIDEINRGKIDKIFGELLYLLEYRNESIKLHYSGEDFSIPENLFLVGTMNTADKSIALLDVALRRRFWFVRCEPQEEVLIEMFDIDNRDKITADDNGKNVKQIALRLFNLLNGKGKVKGILDELGDDAGELKIGHSYFLKLLKKDNENNDIDPSFSDLKNIWFYSIIPLMEEYCNFNRTALKSLFTAGGGKDFSSKEEFKLENMKNL